LSIDAITQQGIDITGYMFALYFVKTGFHFGALYLNLGVYVALGVVSVNEEICENKSFGREIG